jgi:Kef-type K+ transport system membrane component KefB
MLVASIQAPSGPVLEFLVLFAVILFGPVVVQRLGLPGLIGLLLGGFAIGPHGLGVIAAGDQTVPALGQLGLLYLMFIAGLELDLHVLRKQRNSAVLLGLAAFAIPFSAGLVIGWALGWSVAATCLLGALFSSHTLIVYPTLRDAGLGGNPAVATAVGATVLTDTLALVVLAVVAGTQTASADITVVLLEIALGFAVLVGVGLLVLPRLVDGAMRMWGGDRVARYVVVIVALLAMAALAEVFGIEPIIGAFFAGLALNRLVPNEGRSMDRVEFFGSAVLVPVFVVSIGLLLDPSVMFTADTLELAGLICLGALGGKAIACWFAGAGLGFSRPERAAMYALTAPQAAATLAVTLIGFELGLFDTSVVNAVLVLILVSISVAAVLAQRVVTWVPHAANIPPLGHHVLVVTAAEEPSDEAMRIATLLARPDGGNSDVLIARGAAGAPPDAKRRRAIEQRLVRHGFDGTVHVDPHELPEAIARSLLTAEPSLVIVDDPDFDAAPGRVPMLVVGSNELGSDGVRLLVDEATTASVSADITNRLNKKTAKLTLLRRPPRPPTPTATPPS